MKAMQKEQLLNSLGQEAREALENAKRLALWKGGQLTPLHLMVALLEYLMASSNQVSSEPARLLQTAHEVLTARFPLPYQGASITITKETQRVIAEAYEVAKNQGKPQVAPLHLLQASMESANVKEALFDAKLRELALQAIEQDFQSITLAQPADRQSPAPAPREVSPAQESAAQAPSTPPLSGVFAEFCTNLAEESLLNAAHQFVGREREMTAVLETLCRKLK